MITAVHTRRLYAFEFVHFDGAFKSESHADLRRLLDRVWLTEAPRRLRNSQVALVFGKGTAMGGRQVSYAMGRGYIELAPGQRTRDVLLHEVTHCLGFSSHGEGFVGRYFGLLERYAGVPPEVLDASRIRYFYNYME